MAKNKGQIMKAVMAELKGKADGKVINQVVAEAGYEDTDGNAVATSIDALAVGITFAFLPDTNVPALHRRLSVSMLQDGLFPYPQVLWPG